jgi:hypothetical protein
MKTLWKAIAKVAFYAIGGMLMIYAAARSLHFIQATLSSDQQILGFLALAATSGGAVAWLLVFLHAAEGVGQKATAGIMVVVCLLGEFALFAFDTLLESGNAGMIAAMTSEEIRTVVMGMSGLIAINIGATIAFHLVDPGNMKDMREDFVKAKLEDEAMKLIEKRGEEIARDMAPKLAEQWADEFEQRFNSIQALGIGRATRDKSNLTWPWQKNKDQAPALAEFEENPAVILEPAGTVGFTPNGNGHKPAGNDNHPDFQ